MPWFKATDEIQIAPNQYVQPGQRFEYPYHAGKALVSGSRAEWSHEPTDEELDEQAADEDGKSEPPEPESTDDGDVNAEPTPIATVDFTDVDGIGDGTAEDMEGWLADEGVETVEALLERELTDMPGVGPATADDIRTYLRELGK